MAQPTNTFDTYDYKDAALEYGQTYYWRIDEHNDLIDPCVWPGDMWRFIITIEFPASASSNLFRISIGISSGMFILPLESIVIFTSLISFSPQMGFYKWYI